jgi:hypothetical protein
MNDKHLWHHMRYEIFQVKTRCAQKQSRPNHFQLKNIRVPFWRKKRGTLGVFV